ncbi:VanZ family protein [Flavicella sp.]|uniref:VanZ family protein n=1 Tax=Flavicella sp. TaxID=2957742 RepID=UPI00301A46B0
MLKRISHLYKHNSIGIAIIITILIVYLSLSNINSIKTVNFNHIDKYQHSLAYFSLMISWLLVSQKLNKKIFRYWMVLSVFLLGVLMEILQQLLTTDRQADLFDVFANTSGIIVAYIVFEKVIFKGFKEFLTKA